MASACTSVSPILPAITEAPGIANADGRIVWHDLLTTTPDASRRFYGELFGWEFERPATGVGFGDADTYMLIRHQGELIGGMLDARIFERGANISQWIAVMSVTDIETSVARVIAGGGEVLTPPTDVGPRGSLAVIAGPDKGLIALLQSSNGLPAEREPAVNGWLWNELWTDDVTAATGFYRDVAGYDIEDHDVPGASHSYRLLKSGGEPRAAILPNPFADVVPVWVNYLRVDDPAAIAARVDELGGQVLVEAQSRPIGGQVAFIAGPSGAGIALQTWAPDAEGEQE